MPNISGRDRGAREISFYELARLGFIELRVVDGRAARVRAAGNFDRALLPPPRSFYQRELAKLRRSSQDWAKALCCFHHDHDPSLSVNLCTGGFLCFSCGARGGDLIDFVRLRDGVGFLAAARSLGALRAETLSPRKRQDMARRKRERERLDNATENFAKAERALRLFYRDRIHALERIRREAQEQLGDPSASALASESCWAALQETLQLREAVAAYALLSNARTVERVDFVLHPGQRAAAIAAVINHGMVRNDAGWVTEVAFP
jgi:hypothetical protein